ncbi:MAG: exodeoxyribonuclease V subunit gamma [Burkholderiaceae bacterium]
MLHIHFANRYETLTQLLLRRLGAGRSSVFAADQIIVPSAAVRRSLTLAIADHDGICANVQFDFLARWLWRQIGRLVSGIAEESPFAPAVLTWRVFTALSDKAFSTAHPRLAAYLDSADDVMRYELAHRVAALLDQYVTYRPDWLEAWQQQRPCSLGTQDSAAHKDEGWQAALWRCITGELGLEARHPGASFVEALQRSGPGAAARAGLPTHAHLFALPTMPPLHIGLLQQVGRAVDLHLYVLNPCREYWFEVIDRRRLSHLAARGRAQGHEEGNRLLAAWGRQTLSHVDLLVESCGDAATDDAHFEPHPADSLLAQLHNAILDLRDIEAGSFTLAPGDRSLEVHVCHSMTRELEVLHDHLLGLFADAAAGAVALRPCDILVVTPDLEAAAALIDAVFGTAPKDRFIAYSVSGRARSRVNAPARALLALLSLAASRFTASDIFGLLQQAIVARRFDLDDDALQQVHDWMRESGMRWALDAEHRASFDVPAHPRHTLADALDRLFLGYALPAQVAEPFAQLLPSGDAQGSAAVALGAFWRYAESLQRLHAALRGAQTPSAWAALLLDALETFTQAAGDEIDELRELQDTIRELTQAMHSGGVAQAVPLGVVRTALEQLLDDPARGGVPTGSVTFASMSSLRYLPFAVVCAIGLNDGAFPTGQRPPEFDLMALQPRRGDRQRRDDERNLFLDLLLAARSSLYLSYAGRSVRDNAPLPASVLVSELLEAVLPAIADDPASADSLRRARQRLVVEHPLQPFSISAFAIDGDPRLRSFNRELGDALRRSLPALALPQAPAQARDRIEVGDEPGQDSDTGDASEVSEVSESSDGNEESDEELGFDPLPPFFGTPLSAPEPQWREVSLAQLCEFFRNPCRYLLRRRLGITLQRDAEELQDDEPFLPDWPGRNALARRLLDSLLRGATPAEVARLASAGIEMPSGALGAHQLELELESLSGFAARVREATGQPILAPHQAAIRVELDAEVWQVRAGFADLRPSGLVRWRYDKMRANDRLDAWIWHLALCADPPGAAPLRTHWLAQDGALRLKAPDQPIAILGDLLRIYRRGLREPVHFFPKSAWAYCENGHNRYRAEQAWRVSKDRPYAEGADSAYRLALRGPVEPLNDEFFALAKAVFGPLREHVDAAP